MMRITAHLAMGHGFQFFADSLNSWGQPMSPDRRWDRAWEMMMDQPDHCMDPELAAQTVAEEIFRLSNQHALKPTYWAHGREYTRSLSVGDVLVFDVDGEIVTLGIDSVGFKTLSEPRLHVSKNHLAWASFPNTTVRYELYLDETGDLVMAPETNAIDLGSGMRWGRWECYARDVNARLKQLEDHSTLWDTPRG